VAAIKSFVASGLLVLVLVPAAARAGHADSPVVKTVPADQAWAQQALLRPTDFGFGWRGGQVRVTKLVGPSCPGFDPKESDLVVTGHANATFQNARAGVQVSVDSQVLETSDAVQTDFARTIRPPLAGCLAHQLRQGPNITAVTVVPLDFPKVGSVSAAYRATFTLKANGSTGKFLSDYLFFANGRLEYSVNVIAPFRFGPQIVPFEADMARMLVKRGTRPE
jgi:hypothetical protein